MPNPWSLEIADFLRKMKSFGNESVCQVLSFQHFDYFYFVRMIGPLCKKVKPLGQCAVGHPLLP
jgi:hypothetical protein